MYSYFHFYLKMYPFTPQKWPNPACAFPSLSSGRDRPNVGSGVAVSGAGDSMQLAPAKVLCSAVQYTAVLWSPHVVLCTVHLCTALYYSSVQQCSAADTVPPVALSQCFTFGGWWWGGIYSIVYSAGGVDI